MPRTSANKKACGGSADQRYLFICFRTFGRTLKYLPPQRPPASPTIPLAAHTRLSPSYPMAQEPTIAFFVASDKDAPKKDLVLQQAISNSDSVVAQSRPIWTGRTVFPSLHSCPTHANLRQNVASHSAKISKTPIANTQRQDAPASANLIHSVHRDDAGVSTATSYLGNLPLKLSTALRTMQRLRHDGDLSSSGVSGGAMRPAHGRSRGVCFARVRVRFAPETCAPRFPMHTVLKPEPSRTCPSPLIRPSSLHFSSSTH